MPLWAQVLDFMSLMCWVLAGLETSLWLWEVQCGSFLSLFSYFLLLKCSLVAGAPIKAHGKGKEVPHSGQLPSSCFIKGSPNPKSMWLPEGSPLGKERYGPLWSSPRNSYAMETSTAGGILPHARKACRPYVNTQVPVCTNVGPWHWQALFLLLLQGVDVWALAVLSGIFQPVCLPLGEWFWECYLHRPQPHFPGMICWVMSLW